MFQVDEGRAIGQTAHTQCLRQPFRNAKKVKTKLPSCPDLLASNFPYNSLPRLIASSPNRLRRLFTASFSCAVFAYASVSAGRSKMLI